MRPSPVVHVVTRPHRPCVLALRCASGALRWGLVFAVACLAAIGGGCASRSGSTSPVASAPRQAATPASTAAWQEIARVPLHAQRQQDSVREAARTGRHPERLSLACSPTPFRWEAYRHDPMAYLDVIEPGRALAPADPGPDVPPLRRDGPEHVPTSHGQWTALRVHAAPRAPVSGASLDKGIFDNGLSAITVQCDDAGVAVLRYTATLGTEADVRIVAASPAASGLARWVLTVVAPAAPRSVAPAAR